MTESTNPQEIVHPDLVRRTGGGWLAIAPSGATFSIGVTAPTEEEAREKFKSVLARWFEIISEDASVST